MTASDTKDITVSGGVLNYCDSSGTDQKYEWIGAVSIGGFLNSSGPSGYSDFTGQVIEVIKENTYTVTLTPEFEGNAYQENWQIWADLNQDGDFTDSGEQLFEGSGNSEVSGNITIPSTALTGNTRLRISMKYDGYSDSCNSFQYGEVEDYSMTISGTAD